MSPRRSNGAPSGAAASSTPPVQPSSDSGSSIEGTQPARSGLSAPRSNAPPEADTAPILATPGGQHDSPPHAIPPSAGELQVVNVRFIIDRLYQDCAPGQFIRELTQNGTEWLVGGQGQVIWTIHRPMYDATGAIKLCCIDTGRGMTGPELVKHTRGISQSGRPQSMKENFGVGGRISTVPANPEGVIYLSWVNGQGAMVILKYNQASDRYQLETIEQPDGSHNLWAPIPDTMKPSQIDQHGTVVVLLGRTANENTAMAPEGMPHPKRWITRYLNGRYFRFPAGADVRVHEGWQLPSGDQHNFYRVITGLEPWLKEPKNEQVSGSVPVTGATVHWWILKETADTNSGHYPTPGIVGALWQNELYDLVVHPSGNTRIQQFGIVFGMRRIVLIIEPDPGVGNLTSNTARTTLLLNKEPLPWADWAADFRAEMPAAIKQMMEDSAPKSSDADHQKTLMERLKAMADLFRFSRYRPQSSGPLIGDPVTKRDGIGTTSELVDESGQENPPRNGGERRNRRRTTGGAAEYFTGLVSAGQPGTAANSAKVPEIPRVHWVSVTDGTRERDEMEDHAASYVPEANTLKINADFRVFTDLEKRWIKLYGHIPGAAEIVRKSVREWFEWQLIEAVLAAKALEGSSPRWTATDVQDLVSEKALTAVVLPRYHVDKIVGRVLGEKITSLRNARNLAPAAATPSPEDSSTGTMATSPVAVPADAVSTE